MTALPAHHRLAEQALPSSRAQDGVLVLLGAGVVAGFSQVLVPLPFTPVPLSLGTFGALLVGATLGPWRGTLSLLCYLGAGLAGLPWFAGAASGWQVSSLGYIVGYVLAAYLIGTVVRRYVKRKGLAVFAAGWGAAGLVYLIGVPWLMAATHIDLTTALLQGVAPFLVGDGLKALALACLVAAVARARGSAGQAAGPQQRLEVTK